MEKPKRAFEINIRIGADSWELVKEELERVVAHVIDHGPVCDSVSGGPGGGHVVEIFVTEGMTHERYHAELDAYLDGSKQTERIS